MNCDDYTQGYWDALRAKRDRDRQDKEALVEATMRLSKVDELVVLLDDLVDGRRSTNDILSDIAPLLKQVRAS